MGNPQPAVQPCEEFAVVTLLTVEAPQDRAVISDDLIITGVIFKGQILVYKPELLLCVHIS
jgi:hypothetical protein